MPDVIKNVFVSHHHKDDSSVDDLTKMLSGKGYHLRNSSIRVKPENQTRLDQKKVSDRTIERLLRMKMRWAGQVIVVIGAYSGEIGHPVQSKSATWSRAKRPPPWGWRDAGKVK